MRRTIISVVLVIILIAISSVALARDVTVGYAVIDGKSSGKVNLREFSSTSSNSMGLYFSGTQVILESYMGAEWTAVRIGRQRGWMKSEFLYTGNPSNIASRQPTASVRYGDGSGTTLYEEPAYNAAITGRLVSGAGMLVLGETASNWYYVNTYINGGSTFGYLPKSTVTLNSQVPVPSTNPIYTAPPSRGIGTVTIHQVTKNGANVREFPDANSTMVGYVPMGTSYICLSTAPNGWREILLPTGTRGYISGKLVDFTTNMSIPTYSDSIGWVRPNYNNVRTYAGTSYSTDFMGHLILGNRYPCVAAMVDREWYCVVLNHGYGKGDWLVYVNQGDVTFTR